MGILDCTESNVHCQIAAAISIGISQNGMCVQIEIAAACATAGCRAQNGLKASINEEK
jgi:hypothetical protein